LDVFNGARYFAVTGILLAYHETEGEADPVEKTAFVRKFREYEFRRAMFGMRNLPGLWRRLADLVFRGLTWKIRVVFFDPKLARRNSYRPSIHTKAVCSIESASISIW